MKMAAADQPPPIVCSIVRQDLSDRLQLRGRVIGRVEVQGDFSLQVIKTGPSGSSAIRQSGTFSIPENRERLLGLRTFNLSAGDHFTELSLHVDGQTYTCNPLTKAHNPNREQRNAVCNFGESAFMLKVHR